MKSSIQPIRPEEVAGLSSMFFGGATILAATLAAWNLSAGLHLTQAFAVSDGLLSNWIVWVAIAIALRTIGKHVEREMRSRYQTSAIVVRPQRPAAADDHSAAAA